MSRATEEPQPSQHQLLTQLQHSSAAPTAALTAFSHHSNAPDVDWGYVMREALQRKEIECPIWCVCLFDLGAEHIGGYSNGMRQALQSKRNCCLAGCIYIKTESFNSCSNHTCIFLLMNMMDTSEFSRTCPFLFTCSIGALNRNGERGVQACFLTWASSTVATTLMLSVR